MRFICLLYKLCCTRAERKYLKCLEKYCNKSLHITLSHAHWFSIIVCIQVLVFSVILYPTDTFNGIPLCQQYIIFMYMKAYDVYQQQYVLSLYICIYIGVFLYIFSISFVYFVVCDVYYNTPSTSPPFLPPIRFSLSCCLMLLSSSSWSPFSNNPLYYYYFIIIRVKTTIHSTVHQYTTYSRYTLTECR